METTSHEHHHLPREGSQARRHHDSHAAPQVDSRETTTPPGTVFICPMHPEIRQGRPGTCPKCGMTLEPAMPSLEDDNP